MIMNLKTFFFASLMSLTMAPSVEAQNYQLVWSDEFDNNTLGVNWNVEVVANPSNRELQYYTDRTANVKVQDGCLVLTAIKESFEAKRFTSGRVNSCGKVSFTHGKIEARIKMPRLANGLWPAFWMMGEDIVTVNWPACGEIDIMEAGHKDGIANGTVERLYAGNIHWGPNYNEHYMDDASGMVVADYDITGDFHTFTCVWNEESIECYLDDCTAPYYTASIAQGSASHDYFHKPFHILFNLAVGGDYPGILTTSGVTALPNKGDNASMLIDYVRVYQLEGANNVVSGENDAAVETIAADNMANTTSWYTLTGIYLQQEPTASGIYLHNNKLVFKN